MFDKPEMPDIASNKRSDYSSPIDWVGMDGIAVPILIEDASGKKISVIAKADAYVNLKKDKAKGIHMSRLYLLVQERFKNQELTRDALTSLLADMVASQGEISQTARISLSFEHPMIKPALLSDNRGYQAYPVTITAHIDDAGKAIIELDLSVPYSSTCPCSAALSRQLLAEKIDKVFADDTVNKEDLLSWIASEKGSVATPHSQRSFAYLKLTYKDGDFPVLTQLIPHIEKVMETSVQTAVKREDEQEFARLNAENLMFCEDAARKLTLALEEMPDVATYWLKVEHQESLHAHNAVAVHSSH